MKCGGFSTVCFALYSIKPSLVASQKIRHSAVAVAVSAELVLERLNVTRVTFGELDPSWIASYCDTGDPMDKAGAYGVQGRAAERIMRIEGSFSGVMGLPLFETSQLLEAVKCYSRSPLEMVDRP